MNIKITGTGSSLPKLRITNKDLSRIVDTSDEWIASRTGIRARHIAVEETTTEMSVEAAESALKSAGIEAEDVGIIIAATVSADKYLPGLACEVQKNIGAKHAVAFDLNAACSGFLFALNTAALYLKQGIYQHALIIGAETLSKMVDWTDRSTCVLFGDGAGAAVFVGAAVEQKNLHAHSSRCFFPLYIPANQAARGSEQQMFCKFKGYGLKASAKSCIIFSKPIK